MLFSDPDVAAFIRDNFIAVWESVRPVPVVEIDFGNGAKIKRTVNGNIATYICAPDGRVIDIIPGLNAPRAFLEELSDALVLYQASRKATVDTILAYHRANQKEPQRYTIDHRDMSKRFVESNLKYVLVPRETGAVVPKDGSTEAALLAADSEINRKERKPLIHAILAEKVWHPADLTKRLYKEVLHVDLDDPTLGLVTKAFDGGAYGAH